MFEQINGLPLHPLVVHAVVVLIPLTTFGALLVAIRPRWVRPYGPLVSLGAIAAAVAALVAQQAGNALEAELAYSGEAAAAVAAHGRWGLYVVILSIAFAIVSTASTALAFTAGPDAGTGTSPRSRARVVATWLAVVLGVAATGFTMLAGETGAASVWGFLYGDR